MTKKYPESIDKAHKRVLKRKYKLFFLRDNTLYFRDNGVEKEYICDYECKKKKEVILSIHKEDNARIRTTYERVKSKIYGITLEDVLYIINSCENCLRDRPPCISTSITPIIPIYPRERYVVDTIDMKIYSAQNSH
ncbi:hypothetical protein DMUE_0210 [Dictyocoela muelleri]|nr:hypothetical protein DMUE_0210 [Dictyocoela muelleri]